MGRISSDQMRSKRRCRDMLNGGAVGVDWEETGTWGRSSPGLPGLISLRLSLYGYGLEEGAEVAAHEMVHAYVQHAPVKRALHVQRYVQVLLHGGNTAGLAYSIMICLALPCPALPCPIVLC